MAKITLTDAILWAENLLGQYDVPAAEQATLFRLITAINANHWNSTAISLNQFAAKLNADKRSAKKWIDSLINRGWITVKDDKYRLNLRGEKVKEDEINEPAGYSESVRIDDGINRQSDSQIQPAFVTCPKPRIVRLA